MVVVFDCFCVGNEFHISVSRLREVLDLVEYRGAEVSKGPLGIVVY